MAVNNLLPVLTDISDEVLLHILSYASPKDLARLRQTCRRLNNLVSDQRIWERFLQGYGLSRDCYWDNWTPEEIYKAVHNFRELLGLWFCELDHFGMVVHIAVEQEGIIAYDCVPPLDDSILEVDSIQSSVRIGDGVDYANLQRLHFFRLRRLFGLIPTAVQNGRDPGLKRFLRLVCYQSSIGSHFALEHGPEPPTSADEQHSPSVSSMIEQSSVCLRRTQDGFRFVCMNKDEHMPQEMPYWLELEHGLQLKNDCLDSVIATLRDEKDYDLRLEKFDAKSALTCLELSRRVVQYALPEFGPPTKRHLTRSNTFALAHSLTYPKIDTGFYFGHFSWHGWEVLNVSYADNGWKLVGEKVTGDQMVPAGKPSFRVDFRRRLQLTLEDQEKIASVRAAVKRATLLGTSQNKQPPSRDRSPINESGALATNGHASDPPAVSYPFRVPADCAILGTNSVPDSCLCFLEAHGQIAFPNYCSPRDLPCVFVVFSPIHVGLLWLDLRSFMPMYKVLSSCCS